MGRFSEIDMLVKEIPIDREDSVFSIKNSKNKNSDSLDQISIWEFSEEQLLCFISGKPISEAYSSIINRVITENKTERPKIYQKK